MKAKHTPGPWQLAEKYNCCDVRAVDGPYVASSNASAAIRWDVKEANARLIAAAPDLLEALKACVEYGSMTGADWVADKARAAISKAEGA